MRAEMHAGGPGMDTRTARDGRGGARSAQDACATLVELGRALKGWLFYAVGSPARDDLVERAHRVFRGEIERNGPFALEVRRGAFWLAGTDVAVGVGRLDDLARRLQERSVGRVIFDAEIDPEALHAFLDALAAEPEAVAAAGGFEGLFFSMSRRGVSLNETDWRLLRPARVIPASALETTLPDLPDVDVEDAEEPLSFAEPLPFERDEPVAFGALGLDEFAPPEEPAPPDEPEAIDLLDPLDLTPVPRSALPELDTPLFEEPPVALGVPSVPSTRWASASASSTNARTTRAIATPRARSRSTRRCSSSRAASTIHTACSKRWPRTSATTPSAPSRSANRRARRSACSAAAQPSAIS
jgi:hypothetical protein